jgi:hypothetical protein
VQPRPSATSPTRDWAAGDHTGGPFDAALYELRRRHAGLWVRRLTADHPGDDDNVYFIGVAGRRPVVQVGTGPGGQAPFVVEGPRRTDTAELAELVEAVERELGVR